MTLQVHWHEGLFLQPHHLQAMQWGVHRQVTAERTVAWQYPYGVIESDLAHEALADARIEFTKLHAVMPCGVVVNFPEAARLPSLPVKDRFRGGEPLMIKLAVPVRQPHRPNALESENGDGRLKRLFAVSRIEQPDENTGDNEQTISVRHINARLLVEGDDETELDVMPLLRIVPNEQGKPSLDKRFVPPCLIVNGWRELRHLVEELASHISSNRDALVRQLLREGVTAESMRPLHFPHLLRLRTFNNFTIRLRDLAAAQSVPPFHMYQELWELLAEMAALDPQQDRFSQVRSIRYEHDDAGPVFSELSRHIRALTTVGEEETVLRAAFMKQVDPSDQAERFVCELSEDHVARPNAYFLAVRTARDQRYVQELVEDYKARFKLMPYSKRGKPVFGVPLEREPHPPVQLPVEPGLHYFRLLREADSTARARWNEVRAERKLVAEGGIMEIGDAQLTLCMTIPSMEGGT